MYSSREVLSREEAAKYEPWVPFTNATDANVLANHLNGHPNWAKGSCTVCHPKIRPLPPTSTAESDYAIAQRKRGAELQIATENAAARLRRKFGTEARSDHRDGESLRVRQD